MNNALATQEQAITPMQMIQIAFEKAIEQGAAMEVVGVILQEQNKMIERQDRLAYNDALERIQSKLKVVVKDASIPGKGRYASSKAVDRAILESCKEEGITLSFNSEDSGSADLLRLVCDATLGAYTKRYTLPLPIDGAGAKGGGVMNRTDAACAAVTKGKRYLKNMIFNLRIEEIDEEQPANSKLAGWLQKMRDAKDPGELDRAYRESFKEAEAAGDKAAMFDIMACNKAEKARYK